MENAKVGETISFKSSETLLEESSPEMRSSPAPVVRQAQGATFEKITGKSTLEYKSEAKENLPETVSTAQMLAENRRRWTQQDPANPDNRAL
jgi:hypothetical protein